MKLEIAWRKIINSDIIKRSSHSLATINSSRLILLGGELEPRKPVATQVCEINLSPEPQISRLSSDNASPSPRVGSACSGVALHGNIYIFSGRGGTSMTPIIESEDHKAGVWAFNVDSKVWTLLDPSSNCGEFPSPRSYHAMTTDGRDAVYLHAGCPAQGRLSDLWVFQPSSCRWTRLDDAPEPPRGGSSIAHCAANDKLYRFGGFDGKTEVGGFMDIYEPERNRWVQKSFQADGVHGPLPRSVGTLLSVSINGQPFILTTFGENTPSDKGHAGAGKFLGDTWAWNVEGELWVEVKSTGQKPCARGWFAAGILEDNKIAVQGGLGENNERLDDLWVGTLQLVDIHSTRPF